MIQKVCICLHRIDLGSYNEDQARSVIEGIQGVDVVFLDPEKGEAMLLVNVRACNPDGVIGALLGAGLNFYRYCLIERDNSEKDFLTPA